MKNNLTISERDVERASAVIKRLARKPLCEFTFAEFLEFEAASIVIVAEKGLKGLRNQILEAINLEVDP